MAYTLTLTDGTTTLNFLDSTNYKLEEGGLALSTPSLKQSWGGDNLLRDGSDLIESKYNNRSIVVRLQIIGSTDDVLSTNIRAINKLLDKAMVYNTTGRGANVYLSLKLDAGTDTVYFDVLGGTLDLPYNWMSVILDKYSRVLGATLNLTCKPFGYGAEQTLENYLRNPDFELGDGGSPVHDWAGTNSTLSRVADPKLGTYAMKVLSNCAGGQQGYASQSVTWAAAYQGQAFTLSFFYKRPVGDDREQRVAIWDGVSETVTSALTNADYATSATTLSKTLDAAATELTVRVYSNYVAGADVDDYIYVDQMALYKASSAPTAWISGRQTYNRNDPDNGDNARQINYVDIVGVGGDVMGGLKLYCEEAQNETRLHFGARHGSEARDSLYREQDGVVDATASNNEHKVINFNGGGAGYFQGGTSITITSPPTGLFRCLVRWDRTSVILDYVALGWTYGALTYTPVSTDYVATVANYNWYDLGTIAIPPIDLPSGETAPSFVINPWGHQTGIANIDSQMDVVMLFPLRPGEGYVVGDHAANTRQFLLDGMSDRHGVYIETTADVIDSAPTALVGDPCGVDPVATRYHLIAPSTQPLTDAFLLSAKVKPRYLHL